VQQGINLLAILVVKSLSQLQDTLSTPGGPVNMNIIMIKATNTTMCLSFAFVLLVTACAKDKSDQVVVLPVNSCESTTVSYATDINPIFLTNCAVSGCHDAATSAGGNNWETYTEVSTKINMIICAINHNSGCFPMPRPIGSPKLPDSTIQKIECWTEQGAQNN
jgi:hypothetical protein